MALSDIRPTVRRRAGRMSSYIVGVVVVVLVAVLADWPEIGRQFFNRQVLAALWPDIIVIALRNTILFTLISFVLGLLLAVVLALMKMSSGPAKWFAVGFIELFRGLPVLVTMLVIAFMIPIAFNGAKLPGPTIVSGLLALILVTGAYSAEIIRAGIEAVPKGQREAARSLGMPHLTTTFFIILPQAIRIVIPPITNEFVLLLKDTSLLYVIGTTIQTRELTTYGRNGLTTYASPTPMIFAALLYLIVTIPLTYMVGRLEKRMAVKK
ncbi:MAG: amino acid ABC transporter permease [Propionibacteriaceae bacterium]|jgi:polar amino acid transport system permease protein|nr:amino acid ABC transporter permease [Propionibacteriaceae bacterium]